MNKYDEKLILGTNNTMSNMLKHIKKNSVVLEFGPAMGRLTKYLKENLSCKVYIVEIDPEAYSHAIQFAVDGYCGNIEDKNWEMKFKDIKFDVVVFADVLEHLVNPEAALKNAYEMLKSDGMVLASVPNIAHYSIVCNLMEGKFEYTNTGILDNTHLHFFTHQSFKNLFTNVNMTVIYKEATYYNDNDSTFGLNFKTLSAGEIEQIKKRPFANVFQYIYTAVRTDYFEQNKKEILQRHDILENIITEQSSLYEDVGQGFEANDVLLSDKYMSANGRFTVRFNISAEKKISALRFDPCEYACRVKICEVVSNVQGVQLKPINSLPADGGEVDVFMTLDPIYNVKCEQTDSIRYLQISGVLTKISALEMYQYQIRCVNESKQAAEILKQQITELDIGLKDKNADIRFLKETVYSLQKENIELSKKADERLLDDLSELLQREIDEKKTYRQQFAELSNGIQTMQNHYSELQSQLKGILGSKSWRMTKPFRTVGSFLRRIGNKKLM